MKQWLKVLFCFEVVEMVEARMKWFVVTYILHPSAVVGQSNLHPAADFCTLQNTKMDL